MDYALTTQGQGSTAYLAVSGTTITNASSVNWRIGGKHRIHSLTANAQIAGASNSTQHIVRIYTDGSIAFRTGATDRVRSSAGLVAVDVDFTWSLRNEVGVGMTLALNGTDINTFGTSSNFPINQLHRFSTTAASEVTTYAFFHEINGVLQSSWDDTNATGSGSTWDSSGPVVRTLTITNATGAADSWWVNYGGAGGGAVVTGTFSASTIAGALVSGSKIALSTYAASAVINAALDGYKIAAASFTVSANALASVAGSKIGRSGFQAAANVYFGLGTTLKIAKGSFSAQVIASAYVQGGSNLIITGTFSASAVAGVSMSGSKVGFSGFAASAVANSNVSGSKRAAGTFHAPARATGTGNGFKVAHGSFAAVSHVQANIFGYNASIQMPVTEWVIFTTSQPAIAVLTNSEPSATLFTLSQQVYSIHTNS
jgi:hypothetical protein